MQRFDFLARIMYCRLRFYRIVNWLKPGIHQSDFRALDAYFTDIMTLLARVDFPITNAHIMEIGPGNATIIPYNLLQAGAAHVVLVDKYPRRNDTDEQRRYAREEIEHFKQRWNTATIPFADENTLQPLPRYLTTHTADLQDIRLPFPLDLIYSIAVLQHVPDVGAYLRTMHALLREGGIMIHIVDLKDKWHTLGRPFIFYRYSDRTWNRYLTDPCITYTNRLRFKEYLTLFEDNGFEIVGYDTREYPMTEKKIDRRFAGRDDLHIGDGIFMLRKK